MPTTLQMIGAALFALAIIHTFSTKLFLTLAHRYPRHGGLWHLLGEVEVVFGFWAMVLTVFLLAIDGMTSAVDYIEGRNFTEPMFVFAIMVIAATRPILQSVGGLVQLAARCVPGRGLFGLYVTLLSLVPLLGSFITEPAAMTLAAMMLGERIFAKAISERLKYATLGVLFVNVSIGGTLTPFAAPPVLMVAGAWGWSMEFMMAQFGWKAALTVCLNALCVGLIFRRELAHFSSGNEERSTARVPPTLAAVHLLFLAGVVVFAHYPAMFMGLFLFFLGVTAAYRDHQDRLILREGLLVAFFLAGLVVLGGQQQWWLQPLLMSMNNDIVFLGSIVLTAITDNAALTYLGSLVEGLSDEFKYALVAGAVTGGGLTIIANAPNPAGIAILREYFKEESVHPLGLLLAALPPTLLAALAFKFL